MNKRGDNLAFWTTGVDGGSTLVFSAPITVTTGIEVINASSTTRKAGDRWYDLSGRVVSKPQKGIYINNGKKVVIQ